MAQIIGAKAKPIRCNKRSLSDVGTPDAGQYVLVSSDNSMTSTGQGNFDCYIVGDGSTAATSLTLHPIANGAIQTGEKDAVNGQTLVDELRETQVRTNVAHFVKGGYFKANGEFVSSSTQYYVDHFDLTGYISLTVSARGRGAVYCFILDASDNVLYRWQNGTSPYVTTIDLTQYPTAKYACLSDYGAADKYVNGTYVDPNTTKETIAAIRQSVSDLNSEVREGTMSNSVYWDVPVTSESGYINADGAYVSGANVCVRGVDISEFSRICCWGYSYNTIYNALYDENNNLITTFQGGTARCATIDLSQYPTAKYVAVSSGDSKILAIGGFKKSKVSDILFNVAVDAFFNQQKVVVERLEGFYNGYRAFNASSVSRGYKSNLIAVKQGYHITLSSKGESNTLNYISYDENLNVVNRILGQTINEEIIVPAGVAFYEFFSYPTALVVSVAEFTTGGASGGSAGGNILYGKSYVAIGDSFTAPIGSETIDSGMYVGMSKVYPYIIGNRNDMLVINQGASGTVLNGYLLNARYNDIPLNVDYITIWYGINDSGHHIAVGTIDDEPTTISAEGDTTTCGGFNFFFKWLLTNRPLAHIGVIITDFTSQDRREAIMACCEKWGIPYLDLYDPTIPMIRTRGDTQYPHSTSIAPLGYVEVCSEAKALRNTIFSTDPANTNIHPNNTCHEWQSNLIEQFMRGL